MDFGNTQSSPPRKGKGYGDTLKKGASGEPVFGRPSKPREQEPALSEMMAWQPQTVEKADFKKNKKDILPFEDPQFEFYRSKIQKADNPWVSEARDNYRNFQDPEKDINGRRYNPYSGEYSAPFPPNMSGSGYKNNRAGGAGEFGGPGDAQYLAMRARRAEAAGQEYAASLPGLGDSPQKGQMYGGMQGQMMNREQYQQQYLQGQQQYAQGHPQFGGQGPNQMQQMNGMQQGAMVSPMQGMLSPSQIVNGEGPMTQTQTLHSANRAGGPNSHFGTEGQDDDYMYNEGDEIDPEQAKLDHQHMKDFLRTSRWKANGYTQNLLARPAFHNYGNKNVNPSVGGFLYGQYLNSHNVNPQRGMQPEYRQVYKNAQRFGDRVPPHPEPVIPRPRPPTINEEKVFENEMKRSSLEAEKLNPEKSMKKTSTMKSSGGTVRPASAGRMPNSNSSMNMQQSARKPPQIQQQQQQQQNPAINIQNEYQQPPPSAQDQYQKYQSKSMWGNVQPQQQSQPHLAPKITVTPADLDKQRAQNMNAADKERLMAKIAKDSGYAGNNQNNYLNPQNPQKNGGGRQVNQVGFVDQLGENKRMVARKDSGYDGASSIGKYPAFDENLFDFPSGSNF